MKIIVDAMGGDYAPEVVIDGTVAAVKEYGVSVGLVGDEPRIRQLLQKARFSSPLLTVHHADEVVEMHESAATSFRRKRNSSIAIGLRMVKDGQGDAFFSAGNTGAVVCASTLTLGLLPGIERPGIGTVMPTLKGACLMIDVGANIDPKPIHLLQYGIMGEAYAKIILRIAAPRIGLLNVGEEDSKGTGSLKEAFEMLSKTRLNFIGNVEGKHIFSGDCDVIVCDGFVGNVALKVSEGLAEAMGKFLKRHILSNPVGILAGLMLKPTFKKIRKEIDYSEYGGAPLLGVNGVVIIGHGRSNAYAIKNAIRFARTEVEHGFNGKIIEALEAEQKPQTERQTT
ncbi:MAG: phosphate acyltransferase PlsX [Deltaproteobacteria bacterium]